MATKVKFLKGTQEQFDALANRDATTFYRIVDTDGKTVKAYYGDLDISNEGTSEAYVNSAVAELAEYVDDKYALKDDDTYGGLVQLENRVTTLEDNQETDEEVIDEVAELGILEMVSIDGTNVLTDNEGNVLTW